MTGQVAFDKNYFPGEKEQNRLWRRLDRGSHFLLLAPGRVGKTSMLRHQALKPNPGYIFHYNIKYDLQDRFKPLYFALMHLMKDKYPNEFLRMREELRETVEEILKRIEETAEKYNS